eukprot:15472785-Alexandrium_andersonii.AAC.1
MPPSPRSFIDCKNSDMVAINTAAATGVEKAFPARFPSWDWEKPSAEYEPTKTPWNANFSEPTKNRGGRSHGAQNFPLGVIVPEVPNGDPGAARSMDWLMSYTLPHAKPFFWRIYSRMCFSRSVSA